MKKITSLIIAATTSVIAFSQEPSVEWKLNDIPPTFPNVPLGIPTGNYVKGQPLRLENDQFPTRLSGEDWWYSTNSARLNGVENGYYTAGYATWLDFKFDETQFGGCNVNLPSGFNNQRPVLINETLSAKLATVAKYSKNGQMIWCKAFFSADEGAYGSVSDDDGNIAVVGWSNANFDVQGQSIKLNPEQSVSAINVIDEGLCVSNKKKAVVSKIDSKGNALWTFAYSPLSLQQGQNTINEVVESEFLGVDIVLSSDGNYIISGWFLDNQGGSSIGIIKINSLSGVIMNRRIISILNNNNTQLISRVMSISEDPLDNGLILCGTIYRNSGGIWDGFVLKTDFNLNPTGSFGNSIYNTLIDGQAQTTSVFFIPNQSLISGQKHNIVYDCRRLANGNLAVVSGQNMRDGIGSGSNIGEGYLQIINQDGSAELNSSLINSSRDGLLQAFDFKIGIAPKIDNSINVISTISEGIIEGNPILESIMDQSKIAIGGNQSAEFYKRIDYYLDQTNFIKTDVTQSSALVSKFDLNGNLIWDKVVDSDNAGLQVYPGDWKEQECVYQIMEGSAGELVFVGNTSHNKDDYFIAKIAGECNSSTQFDVEPTGDEEVVEITQNTTWNSALFNGQTEIDVLGDIRVKSGVTLTIDGLIVKFADSRKAGITTRLVIERKGLCRVINGAHLKANDCPESMWDGIQVYGDSENTQTTNYQGKLFARDSKIEDAVIAVACVKREGFEKELLYGGGIVDIENCEFLNNLIGVEIRPYQNISSSGNLLNNKTRLIKNDFIINDLLNDPGYAFVPQNGQLEPRAQIAAVLAQGVRGVSIRGNLFDIQSPLFKDQNKGIGVQSWDAQLFVTSNCEDNSIPANGVCTNTTPNIFKNLWYGVHVKTIKNIVDMRINDNVFDDNHIGVALEGLANFSEVKENTFLIADRSTKLTSFSNIGIWTEDATSLTIEENNFENITVRPDNTSIGIRMRNSNNSSLTSVYRNNFDNLDVGVQTSSDNNNMQLDCNTFIHDENSLIDWHNFTGGQISTQGNCINVSPEVPVLNRFTGDYSNNPNERSIMSSTIPLEYRGYVSEYPVSNTVQNVFLESNCVTSIPDFSESCPSYVVSNSESQESLIALKFEDLVTEEELIDNNETEFLFNIIQNENANSIVTELLRVSPYLSDYILVSTIKSNKLNAVQLQQIIDANAPLSKAVLRNLLNPSLNISPALINRALELSSPFKEDFLSEIYKINTNIPQNVIQNIVNKNSPLTDFSLITLINSVNLTDSTKRSALLLNTPLSEDVNNILMNSSVAEWVIDDVNNSVFIASNPYDKSFATSTMMDNLNDMYFMEAEIKQEVNDLVRFYIGQENSTNAIALLEGINRPWSDLSLLSIYSELNLSSNFANKLTNLRALAVREDFIDNMSGVGSHINEICDTYEDLFNANNLYPNFVGLEDDSTQSSYIQTEAIEAGGLNSSYLNLLNLLEISSQKDLQAHNLEFDSNKSLFTSESSEEVPINNNSIIETLSLSVYPNPASSELKVVLDENFEKASITVYNAFGQEVLFRSIANYKNKCVINTSSLAEGLYILRFDADKISKTTKIIIKR